jgi:hypothetical protein
MGMTYQRRHRAVSIIRSVSVLNAPPGGLASQLPVRFTDGKSAMPAILVVAPVLRSGRRQARIARAKVRSIAAIVELFIGQRHRRKAGRNEFSSPFDPLVQFNIAEMDLAKGIAPLVLDISRHVDPKNMAWLELTETMHWLHR